MLKTVPINDFAWHEFLTESQRNLDEVVSDDDLVVKLIGDDPDYFTETSWRDVDLLQELVDDNTRLFVHFGVDNLDDGIVCADGVTRFYVDPDSIDPEDEDAYALALCEAMDHTYTGDASAIGYVVSRHRDHLTFQVGAFFAGACTAPPPGVEILEGGEECIFYKDVLERFFDRFILT